MKVVIEPLKSRIGLHSSAAQTQASQKLVAVFDRSPVLVCTVFVGHERKVIPTATARPKHRYSSSTRAVNNEVIILSGINLYVLIAQTL